jgi:CBS domain-containing protein
MDVRQSAGTPAGVAESDAGCRTGARHRLRSGLPLEGTMTVRDLIGSRTDVYSIPEHLTVHQAARYMRERRVRAVGVVDGHGHVVGVLSKTDIADQAAAENRCPAWMRVAEIMSVSLIRVSPDRSVDECLRLMDQHRIHHLLVIDNAGSPRERYRGMLSISDVLRVIALDEKSRADLLEAFAFERLPVPVHSSDRPARAADGW